MADVSQSSEMRPQPPLPNQQRRAAAADQHFDVLEASARRLTVSRVTTDNRFEGLAINMLGGDVGNYVTTDVPNLLGPENLQEWVRRAMHSIFQTHGVTIWLDVEEWPLYGNPRSEVKRALLDLEITLCKFDSNSAFPAHRGLQISLHPANHLHYLQISVAAYAVLPTLNTIAPDSMLAWLGEDAEITNIHDELQTRCDHTRQSLKKALSRDGILRLRAVSEEMYRALKTVDVDLALELCREALLWGELCSHLRPSLVDMLGVSNIVPDRNARARPTSEAVAQFMRRMLEASQLWAYSGLYRCALLPLTLRLYQNDNWTRILGLPAAIMVDSHIMDVRVDCQPVQLWVALKAIHMEAARMRHRAQKLRNGAQQRAIWEELRAAKMRRSTIQEDKLPTASNGTADPQLTARPMTLTDCHDDDQEEMSVEGQSLLEQEQPRQQNGSPLLAALTDATWATWTVGITGHLQHICAPGSPGSACVQGSMPATGVPAALDDADGSLRP